MKIVVLGGSGLIGRRLVSNLRSAGHDVLSASPRSGVNAVTGEGLTAALDGAEVVVDVTNSPSFADQAVLTFFENSTRNLIAVAKSSRVQHYLALSVVGADRLPDSGYLRAKVAQEKLIQAAGIPYTILRATQFFEFVSAIAGSNIVDGRAVLPPAMMQPVAAEDVSAVLTDLAVAEPLNGTIELAGPERIGMDQLVQRFFQARGEAREVITNPSALYFGTAVDDQSLTPGTSPIVGAIRFDEWLGELAVAR